MSKKEQSNPRIPSPVRFTLSKSHILRGRRNFKRLFESSSLITSATVNLRYSTFSKSDKGLCIGFIAPKRLGDAVERNHIKRLMREAYRLNQYIISDYLSEAGCGLHAVFMAKKDNLDYKAVEADIVMLLNKLHTRLLSIQSHF